MISLAGRDIMHYLTMQVRQGDRDVRTMVTGVTAGEPGTPGWPPYLVAGRQITRGHYEAVADVATGFKLGDRLQIRRNHYTVVGLTRRMVSSGGDPMVFIPLKDAQEAQFITRSQMEEILIGKLIATSAKQIGMFLVILSIVSAAIVAFIIYTLTLGKIREIAVLKLIGTRNRTIAGLIMQQAIALGVIGFVVGKITATLFMAPIFPKHVLLMPLDSLRGFVAVVMICVLSSIIAIRAALKVDPAEAIGG
jgi:ABC-type antimicrobial peptide transport system permease subunit